MPRASFAELVIGWESLHATTEINEADLPYLAALRERFEEVIEGAKEAHLRQAASKALAQQATRDSEAFLAEGRELATRLRNGVRMQYGLKGEKLTEFGLQPRRTPTKPKPEPTTPPAPPTPESEPTPEIE